MPTTYLYNMTACLLFSQNNSPPFLWILVLSFHVQLPLGWRIIYLVFLSIFFFLFFSFPMKILRVSAKKNVPASLPSPLLIADFREHNALSTHLRVFRCPYRPHLCSVTFHLRSLCGIVLFIKSICIALRFSQRHSFLCIWQYDCWMSDGVADCIGSEVRILGRIEPLTAGSWFNKRNRSFAYTRACV